MSYERPAVAFFASGSGTTFEVVAEAAAQGKVHYEPKLVITDHEDAGVLARVDRLNGTYGLHIASIVINRQLYPAGQQGRGQTAAEAEATLEALGRHDIHHLALMGCLRIIAPQVIEQWGWKPEYIERDPATKGRYFARMSNTHPGILPATGDTFGIHTQERVLSLGLDYTAHTFHAVANGVDEGPVIAQHLVSVEPNDTPETLFARVQAEEKANLPYDLDGFLAAQATFMQEGQQ